MLISRNSDKFFFAAQNKEIQFMNFTLCEHVGTKAIYMTTFIYVVCSSSHNRHFNQFCAPVSENCFSLVAHRSMATFEFGLLDGVAVFVVMTHYFALTQCSFQFVFLCGLCKAHHI